MAIESVFGRPSEQDSDSAHAPYADEPSALEPLRRLAGGIAHDFNNLLTVINGYGQLLVLENQEAGKIREYGREILRAGNKAAAIVEMVMAYAGKRSMREEAFDVNAQLEEMRDFISLFLGESITLDLRLGAGPALVRGDRARFRWGLTNILENSKEAMPDGGRVEIATRFVREGDRDAAGLRHEVPWLEIAIRDTGRGMPKDVLARIFDPYFSTKERSNAPGRGLGLACTKGIVRQLGGGIAAESVPGAGTLIRIGLPVAIRY